VVWFFPSFLFLQQQRDTRRRQNDHDSTLDRYNDDKRARTLSTAHKCDAIHEGGTTPTRTAMARGTESEHLLSETVRHITVHRLQRNIRDAISQVESRINGIDVTAAKIQLLLSNLADQRATIQEPEDSRSVSTSILLLVFKLLSTSR